MDVEASNGLGSVSRDTDPSLKQAELRVLQPGLFPFGQ